MFFEKVPNFLSSSFDTQRRAKVLRGVDRIQPKEPDVVSLSLGRCHRARPQRLPLPLLRHHARVPDGPGEELRLAAQLYRSRL